MNRCVVVAWLLCAWVLWARADIPPGSGYSPHDHARLELWQPHSAYSNAAECERSLRERSSIIGRSILGDSEAATRSSLEVRCLPDTVDPRGPKR